MEGRIMPLSQNAHSLIIRTCKHVTLHDKTDFADVINITHFEMGIDYS